MDDEKQKFLNERHRQRSLEARRLRVAFAASFAFLLKGRLSSGQNTTGVQLLAARAAGVGKDSWCDEAANKTQRSMSWRLLREPLVLEELQKLGVVYDKTNKKWCVNEPASAG